MTNRLRVAGVKNRTKKLGKAITAAVLVSGIMVCGDAQADEKMTAKASMGLGYRAGLKEVRALSTVAFDISLPYDSELMASFGVFSSLSDTSVFGLEEVKARLRVPIIKRLFLNWSIFRSIQDAVNEGAVGGALIYSVSPEFSIGAAGTYIFDAGQIPIRGIFVWKLAPCIIFSQTAGAAANTPTALIGSSASIRIPDSGLIMKMEAWNILNAEDNFVPIVSNARFTVGYAF